MLHRMNSIDFLNPKSNMVYQFHRKLETDVYPQVHDFYELSLLTNGNLTMIIGNTRRKIHAGALVLMRPSDIHSREDGNNCSYINIGFPIQVMEDMFAYLKSEDSMLKILKLTTPPIIQLSPGEMLRLKTRLERLHLLPAERPQLVTTELRFIMIDIVMNYIIPALNQEHLLNCPHWLAELANLMDDPTYFSLSLDYFAQNIGKSKEYICRSFKKYYGVTPNAYLIANRLNYAANLLLHSDDKVVDIAFISGFQSLSRFYHAFKTEFGMSPLDYRNNRKKVDFDYV